LGGPIIKDKLFFFVNGELARKTAPTIYNAGETSALLTADEAKTLADYAKTKYNYMSGLIMLTLQKPKATSYLADLIGTLAQPTG